MRRFEHVETGDLADREPAVADIGVVLHRGECRGLRVGPLTGEPGQVERLGLAVPDAQPPEVRLHRHRHIEYGGPGKPGLLIQLPPGRLQRSLARVEPPAGWLPVHPVVVRITPPHQQPPPYRVHTDDPHRCSNLSHPTLSFGAVYM